jgi:hypothetical protein
LRASKGGLASLGELRHPFRPDALERWDGEEQAFGVDEFEPGAVQVRGALCGAVAYGSACHQSRHPSCVAAGQARTTAAAVV